MNAGCADMSTLHMWCSDGVDGDTFLNVSQHNVPVQQILCNINDINKGNAEVKENVHLNDCLE